MTGLVIGLIVVVVAVLLLIAFNIRIVKQSQAWVMERFGVYCGTWHTGLHIKVPFIEKRRGDPIDLREKTISAAPIDPREHSTYSGYATESPDYDKVTYLDESEPNGEGGYIRTERREKTSRTLRGDWTRLQTVITKDNVRVLIDTVIFYQITDPKLYIYGHENPKGAIQELAVTTLRNLIGELELDEVLTSRDTINSRLRVVLDEATNAWGIKINRVELKNIVPPKSIVEAMEKQMTAERERRAMVIAAEGERKAAILKAEGEKQAAILTAEGMKQAEILTSEGEAEGIRLINESNATKETLTIKSFEAFKEAAQGPATTIIIPSEIQGLAGLTASAAEIFKKE